MSNIFYSENFKASAISVFLFLRATARLTRSDIAIVSADEKMTVAAPIVDFI